MPCTIPSPRNQWGDVPVRGLDPLRTYWPTSSGGRAPSTSSVGGVDLLLHRREAALEPPRDVGIERARWWAVRATPRRRPSGSRAAARARRSRHRPSPGAARRADAAAPKVPPLSGTYRSERYRDGSWRATSTAAGPVAPPSSWRARWPRPTPRPRARKVTSTPVGCSRCSHPRVAPPPRRPAVAGVAAAEPAAAVDLMPQGSFDRARALDQLGAETFDVLVIGGGITGAGVALDAASRGLRTALVERDDFASGTSSKSSKLVHGGLALPAERRRPPRVRGAARAAAAAPQRPAPRAAAAVPHPAVLEGRPDQPEGGAGAGQRDVDVRPHRRRPDRQAPQAAEEGPGRGPHAHAPRGAAGRRLPLLRRRRRRCPPHAHDPAHRGARPRRRGRQPRQGRRAAARRRPGRRRGGRGRRSPHRGARPVRS